MKPTPSLNSPKRGYLYVILAAILWGISGSASKFLFNNGMTPSQLVQIRVTISFVLLLGWLGLRRPSLLKISRRDIFYFAALGTVGMAAVQFTYLFAISKINVAAAILLQYLAPSFIAVHSVVFAGEKLTPSTIFALLGATVGCYLAVGAYSLDILALNSLGIISGVLSALSFAWYSVQAEYGMRRYNPWTVLFFATLFGALVWNILHPPLEAFTHTYSLLEWGWILYVAVPGTLLPFGLYFQGINLIRSTRASITATLEPITAGILSYIFLKEIMEPMQVLGGSMVLGAIILLQLRQEFDAKAPDILRARSRGERNPQIVR